MNKNKWSVEMTSNFIQLYKEHECLWNVKSAAYKNKQQRDAALDDIKTKINIDGFGNDEIKAKVRVLRSTYYQEKKKIQNSLRSGAGTDDVYRPNIKWYYDMDEIMKKIESKTPVWDSLDNQNQNVVLLSDADTENIFSQHESETSTFSSQKGAEKTSIEGKSKKSKISKMASIVKDMQSLSEKIYVDDTEFDIFGSSVAAQLKKLSENQAMIAQEKIQSILTKCRLEDLRKKSTQTSMSQPMSPTNWSLMSPQPSSSSNNSTYSNSVVYYEENQHENEQETHQVQLSFADNIICNAFNNA